MEDLKDYGKFLVKPVHKLMGLAHIFLILLRNYKYSSPTLYSSLDSVGSSSSLSSFTFTFISTLPPLNTDSRVASFFSPPSTYEQVLQEISNKMS